MPRGRAARYPVGYTKMHMNEDDSFGYMHNDDGESLGTRAGQATAEALVATIQKLHAEGVANTKVATGRFVDADGKTSRSPFLSSAFGGAVGVWIVHDWTTNFTSGTGSIYALAGQEAVGSQKAAGFLNFYGLPEASGYGVATRGAWIDGVTKQRIFIDRSPGD